MTATSELLIQCRALIGDDRPVKIRPAVAEELPGIADLADLVHIEVGDYEFVLIA